MYHQGKTIPEIMAATNLGNHSVQGYLPYRKTIYNLSELSNKAKRLRLSRYRQNLCSNFANAIIGMSRDEEEEYLWKTLSDVSGRIFHTSGRGGKGSVKFTYTIKGGEMFINKKDESITRSSVIMAYHKAKEMGKKARKEIINCDKRISKCEDQIGYKLLGNPSYSFMKNIEDKKVFTHQ